MLKIGFIGAGTVGTALSRLVNERGYPVAAVSSRNPDSARSLAEAIGGCRITDNQGVADSAELIFIVTPDDAIASVASQVNWHSGQSVVHCSGADSTDILEPARKSGARVGAFHPLQTLASAKEAIENIPGSTFAVEAEEPLLSTLKDMATALGGYWIPPDRATQALLPLLRGTLTNIDTIGIPECLTGPIARGDIGTIKKHLDALQKVAPTLVSTYKELGRQTIPIAIAKGKINKQQAQELKALLKT